jgi:stearoyl-CoA desaturase (Delta-9 desaturase)
MVLGETVMTGYGWRGWQGGFVWTSLLRLVSTYHVSILPPGYLLRMNLMNLKSTFCVDSLCHRLGDKLYDDKLTSKDCVLKATIITIATTNYL